ncbi:MAG: N-acetyltransferase [Firmicutes bacterium]|nr:N-acetyltransferase [Bacillota bacterium]
MIIRRETEEEYPLIYDLVKAAFQTARVSDGKEPDFVDHLRTSGDYIPELALVAEFENRLIGHVMFTRTFITSGGNRIETLLLAPVSVVLERRSLGVGSTLIREGFRRAVEMGYTSTVLVGDPAYYHRFGFRSSVDFGIRNTNGIPDQYVMAGELVPGALAGVSGEIEFFSL